MIAPINYREAGGGEWLLLNDPLDGDWAFILKEDDNRDRFHIHWSGRITLNPEQNREPWMADVVERMLCYPIPADRADGILMRVIHMGNLPDTDDWWAFAKRQVT